MRAAQAELMSEHMFARVQVLPSQSSNREETEGYKSLADERHKGQRITSLGDRHIHLNGWFKEEPILLCGAFVELSSESGIGFRYHPS